VWRWIIQRRLGKIVSFLQAVCQTQGSSPTLAYAHGEEIEKRGEPTVELIEFSWIFPTYFLSFEIGHKCHFWN
jgi:hypothetical protein